MKLKFLWGNGMDNKMNIISAYLFKPDRVVYYMEPTEEEKRKFYRGEIPEALKEHDGAFGTYDCAGLFIMNENGHKKEILGIEFRPDDNRVNYPKGLKSFRLGKQFMISALLTDLDYLTDERIPDSIEALRDKTKDTYFHKRGVFLGQNPELIQVFTCQNCNRILVSAEPVAEETFFKTFPLETEAEKLLYNMAFRDIITGHYNWMYIWDYLSGFGLKGIQDYSFVHFDVKDFKSINVVYGHEVGNHVLCNIVKNMEKQDWIYYSARCDNDNFAMMIKDMPEEETKQKMLQFFDDISILEEDPNYHIYYRCGVVPMRNALLLGDRVADAGKQVQRMGNKLYETEVLFYTDEMHDAQDWAIKIKAYLDTAIREDEFCVYLQPKYDINTGEIIGAEALVRWMYHKRALLSPAKFIPIFEAAGLISKLDDIVLQKVCQKLKEWEEKGLTRYPVSVNLSRKSMGIPNLVEHLSSIVDAYGVDHSLIEFELTESAAYDNQKFMIYIINELKEKGFKISMDDFGTGYSSLSLLTEMPIGTIKIDKSFVDRIGFTEERQKDNMVLKHIISMIKDLKVICLAEGVEDKAQIDILRMFGCEVVQGYYYSKPLPIQQYEEIISNRS